MIRIQRQSHKNHSTTFNITLRTPSQQEITFFIQVHSYLMGVQEINKKSITKNDQQLFMNDSVVDRAYIFSAIMEQLTATQQPTSIVDAFKRFWGNEQQNSVDLNFVAPSVVQHPSSTGMQQAGPSSTRSSMPPRPSPPTSRPQPAQPSKTGEWNQTQPGTTADTSSTTGYDEHKHMPARAAAQPSQPQQSYQQGNPNFRQQQQSRQRGKQNPEIVQQQPTPEELEQWHAQNPFYPPQDEQQYFYTSPDHQSLPQHTTTTRYHPLPIPSAQHFQQPPAQGNPIQQPQQQQHTFVAPIPNFATDSGANMWGAGTNAPQNQPAWPTSQPPQVTLSIQQPELIPQQQPAAVNPTAKQDKQKKQAQPIAEPTQPFPSQNQLFQQLQPAPAQAPTPKLSAFLTACVQGDPNTVQSELSRNSSAINEMDTEGHTALILAVKQGHTHIVEAILNSFNTGTDNSNWVKKNIENLQTYLQKSNTRGENALRLALNNPTLLRLLAEKCNRKTVQELYSKRTSIPEFGKQQKEILEEQLDRPHQAAKDNDIHEFETCLAWNKGINSEDQEHHTPLWYAAQTGHHGSAQWLLQHNVNPSEQPGGKSHPLHIAINKNRVEIVQLLLSYIADIKKEDENGNSAIHLAAKKSVELLNLLGIEVTDISEEVSATESKLDASQTKANLVNIQNSQTGATPLIAAIEAANTYNIKIITQIVTHLLDAKADVTIETTPEDKDTPKTTALELAVKKKLFPIAYLILSRMLPPHRKPFYAMLQSEDIFESMRLLIQSIPKKSNETITEELNQLRSELIERQDAAQIQQEQQIKLLSQDNDAKDKEIARLKAEIAELKKSQASDPTPAAASQASDTTPPSATAADYSTAAMPESSTVSKATESDSKAEANSDTKQQTESQKGNDNSTTASTLSRSQQKKFRKAAASKAAAANKGNKQDADKTEDSADSAATNNPTDTAQPNTTASSHQSMPDSTTTSASSNGADSRSSQSSAAMSESFSGSTSTGSSAGLPNSASSAASTNSTSNTDRLPSLFPTSTSRTSSPSATAAAQANNSSSSASAASATTNTAPKKSTPLGELLKSKGKDPHKMENFAPTPPSVPPQQRPR